MECWMGGQLSAVGFFCLALAWYWLATGRPRSAGAALGLCLYKPTLLVLLVPVLLLARCWRPLAGFALSAAGLAGVSVAAVGWPACLAYARLLVGFAHTTSSSEGAVLPAWKFVDLNSSLRALFGAGPAVWVLLVLILAVPLAGLGAAAWRFGRLRAAGAAEGAPRRLLWAATLTWTPVANLYVGVYDSVLVVLAALLTAEDLRGPGEGGPRFRGPAFPLLLLLVYLGPWFSQHLARATGLQPYSFILLALAAYQLALARAAVAAAEGKKPHGP
jgi:hypothetical protein